MSKKLISALVLARVTQVWAPKFFLWVVPSLDVRHCRGLSSYAITRKAYHPNSRKWRKPHFGLIHTRWAQIRSTIFFFFFSKVWFRKSPDIMVSYHRVQYQENLAIQSWEKLVTDGQTGGGTDGQTDRRTRMAVEFPLYIHVITNIMNFLKVVQNCLSEVRRGISM